MALGLGGLVTGRPDAGVDIDLAVPGRPIGPWSRRTGAPQASATGRDRTPPWSALGPHEVRIPGSSAGTSGHDG
jgi:hypothetical protein